ncbi:MAG: rRNA maturation RNase YbeY [Lachnospiraceae bacterium]|nr:rRNA maturation RNase YbeY [Lachnospiraceae bacterium]
MSVFIESEIDKKICDDQDDIIRSVIAEALIFVSCPYDCEVNVTLVDDERIRELNNEFRNIDSSTDVLSFPMIDFETAGDFSVCESDPADYFTGEDGELMLGDIVISVDHVFAQAEEYGHSVKRELAFLVAHSMLHLSGYDHIDDDERLEMERMQDEILQNAGYTRDI